MPEIKYSNPEVIDRLLQLRREHRISWRALGLGMVISSFADKDTGEAWPSRAMLSRITGIESREIPRVVCDLQNAGFMTIEKRSGCSNIYRLTCGDLAACGEIAAMGKQPPTCGETAAHINNRSIK